MKTKTILFLLVGFCLGLAAFVQASGDMVSIVSPADGKIVRLDVAPGDKVFSGDSLAIIKGDDGTTIILKAGVSGTVAAIDVISYGKVKKGEPIGTISTATIIAEQPVATEAEELPGIGALVGNLFRTTGVYGVIDGQISKDWTVGIGRILMICVGLTLLYLGIFKEFEPLLLIPIGYGAILSNIPLAGIAEPGGILYYVYDVGIVTGVIPLLFLTDLVPGINFSLRDAASIGIIGGADGPTAIFLSSQLSPRLLGSIAIAAYSYMALVPIIQPPIMKWLTSEEERRIKMVQLRHVSKLEKMILPLLVLGICAFLLPTAAPLIGMFMLGNLAKECGVIDRLSDVIKGALMYTVTIFLGLGVGSKLSADKFLNLETLGILALGMIAFGIGTAGGVLMAKAMNRLSKTPVNPLIGAAGVSAVPMAARVVNKVGLEANPQNHLIMHAMGANVSGVIGSAVAAGVLLALL